MSDSSEPRPAWHAASHEGFCYGREGRLLSTGPAPCHHPAHFAPVAPPRAEADDAEVERVAEVMAGVRCDGVPGGGELRVARWHLAEVAKARAEGLAREEVTDQCRENYRKLGEGALTLVTGSLRLTSKVAARADRAEARAKEAESLLADLRPLLGQRLTDIDRVHEEYREISEKLAECKRSIDSAMARKDKIARAMTADLARVTAERDVLDAIVTEVDAAWAADECRVSGAGSKRLVAAIEACVKRGPQ